MIAELKCWNNDAEQEFAHIVGAGQDPGDCVSEDWIVVSIHNDSVQVVATPEP